MTSESTYILVTGANRGVGRATVAAILEERDDTHVFLGSRSAERGEEARRELVDEHAEFDGRIDVVQLDVGDNASVASAAEAVAEWLDGAPLYGVVNNAGINDNDYDIRTVLDVNVRGPKRVCDAFLPLMEGADDGRVVNVSSASGPSFVASCTPELQARLTDSTASWAQIEGLMSECVEAADEAGGFAAADIGNGRSYGLSKALLNTYTMLLARKHPELTVNACTPGFIETGMTRPMAERRGSTPEEMGMKPPEEGTTAQIFLLFGEPDGTGWYFGSDAKRSPIDRYRSPGDPEYTGN